MGRPINKKFFGNTNSPYDDGQTGGTTGVGGEGVATITTATAGSFVVNDTYQNFPLLTVAAPQIPGGTQATIDVVFELNTVSISSTGTGYSDGLSTSITGMGGGAVVYIDATAGAPQTVDVATTGTNRGEFRRGDFTGAGITTHQVIQSAANTLQILATYRVKRITVLVPGSGYTTAPNLSWGGHTFTGQTTPSGQTPALTSSRQNALNFTAWVPTASNGTVNSGGSAVIGDIVKQQGTSRYYVKTAQGYGVCKLVATTASIGTMVLLATDANGNTYYVTRLASRKARLTQKTQNGVSVWVYETNDLAKWTLAAANGTNKSLVTTTVSISNV